MLHDAKLGKQTMEIALLTHTSNEWIRSVLRGIAGYAHEQGGWDFILEPRGLDEPIVVPPNLKADGIIARNTDPDIEEQILALEIPVVNISWKGIRSRRIPSVISDERACAQLAAAHFLQKGYRYFGYLGPANISGYGNSFGNHFRDTIEAHGFECSPFPYQGGQRIPTYRLREPIREWLKPLNQPVAILVWNSDLGREVTAACQELSIEIPAQVSILCLEYDSLMSSLAPVPLSNLDQAGSRVGYEAARLLKSLVQGSVPPKEPVLIPPNGIVGRQSSDAMGLENELVAAAIRFISENTASPIQVRHICEELRVSRRNLETQFAETLGSTPAREIRRIRLERVKRLLVETDLPLLSIAKQSGYNHVEVMIRNFTKHTGSSPSEFRRSNH